MSSVVRRCPFAGEIPICPPGMDPWPALRCTYPALDVNGNSCPTAIDPVGLVELGVAGSDHLKPMVIAELAEA